MKKYLIENGYLGTRYERVRDNVFKQSTGRPYIPLDKSWMIRIGVLDLFNGYKDSQKYLEQNYDKLGEDLQSLYKALVQWGSQESIDVGESATLYRFLRFASWKLGSQKNFIRSGTLAQRKICDDPDIINWPLYRLLTLDNGTSQWASASILSGSQEKIENPPYKIQLTYDAVKHWNDKRLNKLTWEPRYDETIFNQASSYLQWLKEGKMDFVPQQAEDYCFARAFDIISAEDGAKRWPSLRGHESDRISEMEKDLEKQEITSRDHRVVQAIAMLRSNKYSIIASSKIKYPYCVNKSWPQFWEFLKDSEYLSKIYDTSEDLTE